MWGDEHVISASDDGTARIWSMKTRDSVYTFMPHPQGGEVSSLFDIAIDSENMNQVFACTFGGDIVALRMNLERKDQLSGLRVSELKAMLRRKEVSFEDCMFKTDLVNRYVCSHPLSSWVTRLNSFAFRSGLSNQTRSRWLSGSGCFGVITGPRRR